MKHRFETQKSSFGSKKLIISIGFFFLVIAAFTSGTALVADRTDAQEQKTLEQAVRRGIVHCYSTEGSYPESLSYLKEHYGLYYDENRFFVDYQVYGSNIPPEVTIIDRGKRQ